MITDYETKLINTKKKVKFARIQKTARKYYQKLQHNSAFEYQTLQGKRLRAAIQQLMELADGEKEWVNALRKSYTAWQNSRRTVFKISVALNKMRGGGIRE
jgi:hypothetical protein